MKVTQRLPRRSFGLFGQAARIDQRGARHHHAACFAHGMRHHCRIGQARDAHRHVDAFFNQIDDAVEQQELDIDFRVLGHERRSRGCHEHSAKGHRRRDTQAPAWGGAARAQALLRFFDRGDNLPAAFVVVAAFVGQRHAAGGAIQEAHAKIALQRRQRAHHRGLRHVESLSRGGDAAAVDDFQERLDGVKLVHGLA